MSVKPTSVPTKRLAGSILSTDMVFRVDNILGWDGLALTASDFGTQGYGVFRDSARTRIELFEFDPSTIADAEITIVLRGLKFTGDRVTEEADNKFDWTAGDTYVDLGTDTPQLIQYFQDYIDALAIAGAPLSSTTVSGLVEEATAAEIAAATAAGATTARLFVNPSNYLPVGTILMNAAATAPTGWLLCYGQAVSRSTYANLFTALSTTYGVGDGSTTFNLPDLRGRAVAGMDNMGGSSANRVTNVAADSVGGVMGTETHTLTTSEMPSHSHYASGSGGSTYAEGTGSFSTLNGLTTAPEGGGQAHNNMQPTMFMHFIIKV